MENENFGSREALNRLKLSRESVLEMIYEYVAEGKMNLAESFVPAVKTYELAIKAVKACMDGGIAL